MTLREIVNTALFFVLYLALQVLMVRNVVLFDYGFCFLYVACILLLPADISLTALLLIGFSTGVMVDTFYNTLGMHAAATTLLAFCRPLVVQRQFDSQNPDLRADISLRDMGIGAFFRYVIVLTLIHHTALFFIEASSLTLIIPTLIRIAASVLFTSVTILLIQFFGRN